MIKRKVATIVFYDDNSFIIQDRREISKWGEDYGFFGGAIEQNETPEQAITREIKEELNLEIKDFQLFKSDVKFTKELHGNVERNVFISKMPNQSDLHVTEGNIKLIPRENISPLKMVDGDLDLLREINNYLNKS